MEKDAGAARSGIAKAMRSTVRTSKLGAMIGQRLTEELAKAARQHGEPQKEAIR